MNEYRIAKYINPNGQAVINSGYVWQDGDVIEVDYNITNTTAAGDKMIFYSSGNGNGIWVETYGSKNVWYVRCGQTSSNNITLSSSLRGTLRLQKGSFSVIGVGDLALTYNGPTGAPIYIGGRQDGTGCSYVDIYDFRVYRGGALFKNYVPVQRVYDECYGLIETISGEFFTSITQYKFTGTLRQNTLVENSGSLIISRLRNMDSVTDQYIQFADPNVKSICATNWGADGEVTFAQAAAVTGISTKFRANANINTFNELKYFTGLTTITGGTSNSSGAFYNCTNLKSVILPNSVTAINGYSFSTCTNLESINLHRSITAIQTNAFFYDSNLSGEINLPNLTTLGLNAFTKTGITKVKNLGGITSLGGNAAASYGTFGNCPNLTEITLPATLTSTGNYNIQKCTALKRVIIESSATPAGLTIGTSCFDGDTALESITGLERVTSIANFSFRNTTSLAQDINMPMLTSISGAPFFGSGITSVSSLGSITNLPGGNNASSGAFRNCSSLTDVTLPSTLTTIGGSVFGGCTGIELLTVLATTPPTVQANTFTGAETNLTTLFVPVGTVDTYRAATNWEVFFSFYREVGNNPWARDYGEIEGGKFMQGTSGAVTTRTAGFWSSITPEIEIPSTCTTIKYRAWFTDTTVNINGDGKTIVANFYDSSHNHVGYIVQGTNENTDVTVPTGSKYFRMNMFSGKTSKADKLCYVYDVTNGEVIWPVLSDPVE